MSTVATVTAGMLDRVPHADPDVCQGIALVLSPLEGALGTDRLVALALRVRVQLLNRAREAARREAANVARSGGSKNARRKAALGTDLALRRAAGAGDDDYRPSRDPQGPRLDVPGRAHRGGTSGRPVSRNLGASLPVSRTAGVPGDPVMAALEAEVARTLFRGDVEMIRLAVTPFLPAVGDMPAPPVPVPAPAPSGAPDVENARWVERRQAARALVRDYGPTPEPTPARPGTARDLARWTLRD